MVVMSRVVQVDDEVLKEQLPRVFLRCLGVDSVQ